MLFKSISEDSGAFELSLGESVAKQGSNLPIEKIKQRKMSRSELKVLLSQREFQVLRLIVEGDSDSTIATRLTMSLPTAKTHVRNILSKMAVGNRTQAAVLAVRLGLA